MHLTYTEFIQMYSLLIDFCQLIVTMIALYIQSKRK